ncbi:uncharacterized protein LOC112539141 [Tetranychus urticae]|uniref:uncharacterized protein LOC112539141 n=1 Tax=Tetranychus urticae TaxID=32264 RepID=UPI000D646571|nr:uncharacterized protein LOC112539141 [Tetranychus urticae]
MTEKKQNMLMDHWNNDKIKTIEFIDNVISDTTKFIEFKNKYAEIDIKKVVVQICEHLKKDKTPKDWSQPIIARACKITRFYADIIKKNKENSILNKKKDDDTNNNIPKVSTDIINNNINDRDTDKIGNGTNGETVKSNDDGKQQKENKRKSIEEFDDDIIIDETALKLIKDQDNINPTKRRKIISKNYLQDDDKLPIGWHKVQQLETKPVVIVKPNGDDDVNKTKQLISNVLEEEDKEYGEVEQISKTQKVVVIHFDDITNRDKFMKYAKIHRKTWQCEIPKLKNPCIRINGVSIRKNNDNKIDWDLWLEKLINKNKWLPKTKDSIFKINFKTEKNNKWNIVFEVSPNIRQAIIQKRGKIFLGLQKCDVYDTFNIYTCYNCSAYGHTTNQCG